MILASIVSFDLKAQTVVSWMQIFNNSEYTNPYKMIFDKQENLMVSGISKFNNKVILLRYLPSGKLQDKNFLSLFNYSTLSGFHVSPDNSIIIQTNQTILPSINNLSLHKMSNDFKFSNAVFFSGDNQYVNGKSSAIDPYGNIYVACDYISSNGESVISLLKFSKDCELLWEKKCSNNSYKNNKAVSVKCDIYGFVYIAGINNLDGTDPEFFVKKFSESGKNYWTSNIEGVLNNDDNIVSVELMNIKTDEKSNVYLAGSTGGNFGKDIFLVKLNTEGNFEWNREFDFTKYFSSRTVKGNRIFSDSPYDMETDIQGNVYITGSSESKKESYLVTLKYGSSGNVQWANFYKSPSYLESQNVPVDLFVDKSGNSYITGYQKALNLHADFDPGKDILTLKYSSEGAEVWSEIKGGEGDIGHNDDIGKSVLVNDNGDAFVLGQLSIFPQTSAYCIIKYGSQNSSTVNAKDSKEKFRLNNNYPNPFNPSTIISFEIPEAANVSLKIYDITGKEISSLFKGMLNKGYHEFEWNAAQLSSGVYFYRLQAGSFTNTKKMHLIK